LGNWDVDAIDKCTPVQFVVRPHIPDIQSSPLPHLLQSPVDRFALVGVIPGQLRHLLPQLVACLAIAIEYKPQEHQPGLLALFFGGGVNDFGHFLFPLIFPTLIA